MPSLRLFYIIFASYSGLRSLQDELGFSGLMINIGCRTIPDHTPIWAHNSHTEDAASLRRVFDLFKLLRNFDKCEHEFDVNDNRNRNRQHMR